MADPVVRRVDLSTKIYYGFGAVANGAKSNGFNYLLLFYYSQVIGLRADLVSLGILIALVVDAISDPLVGYISDNFHSKWGRRHPFMYAAGLPVAVAYYFLWAPPEFDQTGLFLYFVCIAVLIRTLITFYEIPATALVAELTDDYDQRTEMMSFRFFFGWWGGLTMAVMNYLVFLPEEKGGLEYVEPIVFRLVLLCPVNRGGSRCVYILEHLLLPTFLGINQYPDRLYEFALLHLGTCCPYACAYGVSLARQKTGRHNSNGGCLCDGTNAIYSEATWLVPGKWH